MSLAPEILDPWRTICAGGPEDSLGARKDAT